MAKTTGDKDSLTARAIIIHDSPRVYLTALHGRWLLGHSTTSWRLEDPETGFQRIVDEKRAKEIARHVLDQGLTFPNALTLATKAKSFTEHDGDIEIPARSKFLVLDGQHRLWAQKFASDSIDCLYPCVVHMGLTKEEMARLFLQINDKQRRVPSSLRWDLYRLVKSTTNQVLVVTSDIVYELSLRPASPFYNEGPTALDLTGEKPALAIKQGSLAPEIKRIVTSQVKKGQKLSPEQLIELLIRFFVAIKSLNGGWGDTDSPFYNARVLRALLRVLDDILKVEKSESLTAIILRDKLSKIDVKSLSPDELRKVQGATGVADLYAVLAKQVSG